MKMIRKNEALETIKGRIFKVDKSRWWVAESESLDVITQGKSHKDAIFILKDAIKLLATEYKLNLSVRIVPGKGDAVCIGTDDTKAMLTFLAHRQRQKDRRLLNGMNIKDIRENYKGKIGRKNEVEVFQGKLIAEESSAMARRLTGRSPQKRSPSQPT